MVQETWRQCLQEVIVALDADFDSADARAYSAELLRAATANVRSSPVSAAACAEVSQLLGSDTRTELQTAFGRWVRCAVEAAYQPADLPRMLRFARRATVAQTACQTITQLLHAHPRATTVDFIAGLMRTLDSHAPGSAIRSPTR